MTAITGISIGVERGRRVFARLLFECRAVGEGRGFLIVGGDDQRFDTVQFAPLR